MRRFLEFLKCSKYDGSGDSQFFHHRGAYTFTTATGFCCFVVCCRLLLALTGSAFRWRARECRTNSDIRQISDDPVSGTKLRRDGVSIAGRVGSLRRYRKGIYRSGFRHDERSLECGNPGIFRCFWVSGSSVEQLRRVLVPIAMVAGIGAVLWFSIDSTRGVSTDPLETADTLIEH